MDEYAQFDFSLNELNCCEEPMMAEDLDFTGIDSGIGGQQQQQQQQQQQFDLVMNAGGHAADSMFQLGDFANPQRTDSQELELSAAPVEASVFDNFFLHEGMVFAEADDCSVNLFTQSSLAPFASATPFASASAATPSINLYCSESDLSLDEPMGFDAEGSNYVFAGGSNVGAVDGFPAVHFGANFYAAPDDHDDDDDDDDDDDAAGAAAADADAVAADAAAAAAAVPPPPPPAAAAAAAAIAIQPIGIAVDLDLSAIRVGKGVAKSLVVLRVSDGVLNQIEGTANLSVARTCMSQYDPEGSLVHTNGNHWGKRDIKLLWLKEHQALGLFFDFPAYCKSKIWESCRQARVVPITIELQVDSTPVFIRASIHAEPMKKCSTEDCGNTNFNHTRFNSCSKCKTCA